MKAGTRAVLAIGCALAMAGVLSAWVPLAGALRPDGPVPITVALTETAPVGSTGDFFGAAVEAMTLWNAKLQRVQLAPVPLEGEAWYENGRNELFFDGKMFEKTWPSGVLAVTATTEDRGTVVETDIIFNASRRWSVYRGNVQSTPMDVRRVVVHELGHLLGLDHPDEAKQTVAAIMNSTVGAVEGPTADDEAGVRGLYDFGPGAAPVILAQPKAQTVMQGAAASLSVRAGGRGPLTYEWRREGVAIPGATSRQWKFSAGLADAGRYTAVVRSAAGEASSASVVVTVEAVVPPTVALSSASAMSVVVGDGVTLIGAVTGGNFPMRLEWRRNGLAVPEAIQEVVALKDLQLSDAGDYTFTATNGGGSATSRAVALTVVAGQPPRLSAEPRSRAVAPGGAVSFVATPAGAGAMSYQWWKDGVIMPGKTNAVLTIEAVRPEDLGRYAVVTANSFGALTSNAAVLSSYERTDWCITRQPASVTEVVGAKVVLAVETDAPTPSFRWFKDGAVIAGAAGNSLVFEKVAVEDRGVYVVEVSDGKRAIRGGGATLGVQVEGRAFFMDHPATHTVVEGGAVSLSGTVRAVLSGGGSMIEPAEVSYQWLKDGRVMAGKTSPVMEFPATAADAGAYRLRATTGVNTVESETAEVVILPAPGLLTRHPPSTLFERDSATLRLAGVIWAVLQVRGRREFSEFFYTRNGISVGGIPYATTADLPGTYTFTVAKDGVRETSRPFVLGFIDRGPPVFSQHPRSAAVEVGAEVTLSVSVRPEGRGVFYKWSKNGVPLPTSDSYIPDQTRFNYGNSLTFNRFAASDQGDYTLSVRNDEGETISETATLTLRGWQAPVIVAHPVGMTAVEGSRVLLTVTTRSGAFRYQWSRDGRPISGATGRELAFTAAALSGGDYAVAVTDGIASETSRPATVVVLAASRWPEIWSAPRDAATVFGGDAVFSVAADGGPLPDRYQWKKNGVDIPGATDAKLKLRDVTGDAAGAYSVVVTNSVGSVTSRAATLTVDARGRLVNLATRAAVGRDGDILIAGFVIGGTESRQVLVRGIGDQLSEFGVSGVLRDPVVSLYDAAGKLVDSNDDWFRLSEDKRTALEAAAKQVGAFAQRDDARDGALLATLTPGSYTVKVAGLANTTGVGLVEVYELGKPGTGRLINLSSRAVVGTGSAILIPGLVLNGQTPRRLLLRAVGPGLAEFGVAGTLGDPVMTLFRRSEEVARNDNWGEQAGAGGAASVASIRTTMAAVGAFGLKDGSRDAVLLLDLPPGSYTVQVAGVADATGVALVEVYEVGL